MLAIETDQRSLGRLHLVTVATLAAFAAPSMAAVSWQEDFSGDNVLGTGIREDYVPGTNWTAVSERSLVAGTTNKYVRVGNSSGVGPVEPGSSKFSAMVMHKSVDDAGTYYLETSLRRSKLVFAYQDSDNYLYVDVYGESNEIFTPTEPTISEYNGSPYTGETSLGSFAATFGIRKDGVTNPLVAFGVPGELNQTINTGLFQIWVDWSPTTDLIDVTITATEGDDMFLNVTRTGLVDPGLWESGNAGFKPSEYFQGQSPSEVQARFMSYSVPEPSGIAVGVLGSIGVLARRRRE